jgi:hypothetical protein
MIIDEINSNIFGEDNNIQYSSKYVDLTWNNNQDERSTNIIFNFIIINPSVNTFL